ncbi:hypothetical protein V7S43_008007 [Phytophthora oleae]|uniref:RxLR effector protein n=1 Tax=Phytophthora oleae TaxID=2107226 RepID=A0ABD3FJI7_9STRA
MFKLLHAIVVFVALNFTQAKGMALNTPLLRVGESRSLQQASTEGSSGSDYGDVAELLYEKCSALDHFKFWTCCGWGCA